MHLTSNHLPSISNHAYERAKVRMGLDRPAFDLWVRNTWPDWEVGVWHTLRDYVKCTSYDGSSLMVCPWSPRKTLVLPVSPDHCLKTVMYYDPMAVATHDLANSTAPSGLDSRLLQDLQVAPEQDSSGLVSSITRLFLTLLAQGQIPGDQVSKLVRNAMDGVSLESPTTCRAADEFVSKRISMKQFKSVAGRASEEERERALMQFISQNLVEGRHTRRGAA
jgi:hypothetical protein